MSTDLELIGGYELHERLGHAGIAAVWKDFAPQVQHYAVL